MDRKKGMMLNEVAFRNLPVLLKDCGFDFFIVDTEHGGFDYSDLSSLFMVSRLCGLKCLVRLPDNGRREITRLLDLGAEGLLLPMTETAEQIGQVVTYARYFPLGQRGISTMRPHSLYHPGKLEDYMPAANRRISIFAQIESRKGLKEAETILQTKGVDGLFIGPNDLSCDLGFPPDAKQKICGEILRLGQCASDCGKACGIITSDPTYLKQAKQAGLSHFCVGSELSMLKSAALATVQEIEVD